MNTSQKQVRVRFAPSPTGYLHVGGARTALFNWLYARHTGGKFILRIEDTDQERSTPEAERMQIEDLTWLGFIQDEGPQASGPFAPYRQSERLEIYKKYATELLETDRAYPCFCSDEILTEKREAAMKLGTVPQYDGTCRKISKEEAKKRKAAGERPTVRFKAPVKEYRLQDAVRGEVVFQPNMVGDFILLRADGMPVYNFCCVVDDYLMGITHVIRAEEHLSNTVRQMMLFQTFNWEMPTFAHCGLILGADRQKLSKRHGATSVHQYAEEGFLKEALLNFLLLLGWSSPEHKEILPMDEIIKQFDLDRINRAPSVFDPVKLRWMNGQYIKALPLSEITERTIPYLEQAGIPAKKLDREWLEKAFDLVRGGLETLCDAAPAMQIFFNEEISLEDAAKTIKSEPAFGAVSEQFIISLREHLSSKGDSISDVEFISMQDQIKTKSGQKGKNLFMPMRVCVTGQTHGPELKLVVPLLGAKKTLARVERIVKM